MKILFIHQNFPGQFKNFAPALASRGHEVVALTLRDVKPQYWNGVEIVPYKLTRNLSRDIHSWVKEIEIKIVRGAACLQAAINLERRGFTPDLIIAHHGWGESAFLKDLWQGTKLCTVNIFTPIQAQT